MTAVKICVTACSLFALAGGADLAWAGGKPVPTTPPTYPPARYDHAFTGNGGLAPKLYMFGGAQPVDGYSQYLNDLWSYSDAGTAAPAWTRISTGRSSPGARGRIGWSCGDDRCVAANGIRGKPLKETWVLTESAASWTQVNCKRFTCPSARSSPTMAYDPLLQVHVLFGGLGESTAAGWPTLTDTFAFDAATMTWTQQGSGATPPPGRYYAAAAFVEPLGRVVMFGGVGSSGERLNDMYSWDGGAWESVTYTNPSDAPQLWDHSVAWNGDAMIVAGGAVDGAGTPNVNTWYVTFSRGADDAWKATWERVSDIMACKSAAGSPDDATLHWYVRMAYLTASGAQVFFGGRASNLYDSPAYGNTVECRERPPEP